MAQDPNAVDGSGDVVKTESEKILQTREEWEKIKKALDAALPICDQINRLKSVANKPNKLKNTIKKRKKQLKVFTTLLDNLPTPDDELVETGKGIAEKLNAEPNAEELAAFSFDVRRFTQSIVKIRRELMDQYKAAKKEEAQAQDGGGDAAENGGNANQDDDDDELDL